MTDYTSVENKLSAATSKKLYFYEGKHAFIPIDGTIVRALHLEESDRFSQEITPDGNGILMRRQRKEQ